MKGVIPICLSEVVIKQFGDEQWRKVLETAGLPVTARFLPSQDIEDAVVMELYKATCSVLRLTPTAAADAFGEHWCCEFAPRIYQAYYTGAKGAKEFLLRMNDVHAKVTDTIANAHPPEFSFERLGPKRLIMKYSSPRGLGDIFVGMVKGVGRYFHEELLIQRISPNAVEITFAR